VIKPIPAIALLTATATAAAVYLSARGSKEQSGQGADTSTPPPQPSILELLGMDNVTAPLQINSTARGIRNNNPLNIERTADRWQGMAAEQTDSRFLVFTDARYGYRAGAVILKNYRLRGIRRLREIIQTWAPSFENNVDAYVNHVAQKVGIAPGDVVEIEDYPKLFAAMTAHENGAQPYALDYIAEGVSWAYA
jgi:hypothetical protein